MHPHNPFLQHLQNAAPTADAGTAAAHTPFAITPREEAPSKPKRTRKPRATEAPPTPATATPTLQSVPTPSPDPVLPVTGESGGSDKNHDEIVSRTLRNLVLHRSLVDAWIGINDALVAHHAAENAEDVYASENERLQSRLDEARAELHEHDSLREGLLGDIHAIEEEIAQAASAHAENTNPTVLSDETLELATALRDKTAKAILEVVENKSGTYGDVRITTVAGSLYVEKTGEEQ